jgi:hypothetical protein
MNFSIAFREAFVFERGLEREKDPRDLTVAERRQKFLAYKQQLATKSDTEDEATRWHHVDDPMTPDQYDQIPEGRPGFSGRTQLLWVRYRHFRRREIVVAKGYFDHEDCSWTARYEPEDDGDIVRQVEATAWAYIESGAKPWDGPIIPRWLRE